MLASISLRPASTGDEGFLRQVYAESRREELDQVAWPEGAREEFLRTQFDAQAAHYLQYYPGAEYLIIERDAEAIGRLYIRRGPGDIRIMDIALLPAARGQKIGTSILQDILDEGQAARKLVSIHVEKFNPALRLYERLGFQIETEHGVYWLLRRPPPDSAAAAS